MTFSDIPKLSEATSAKRVTSSEIKPEKCKYELQEKEELYITSGRYLLPASDGGYVLVTGLVCQDGTHRLQGDTANSTRLATRNKTMPSTEAPVSDIARRRESRPGRQGRPTLLLCLG